MSKLAAVIAASIVNYNNAAVKPSLEQFEKEINDALGVTSVKVWREDKNIPLPVYGKEGDACCDVYAKEIEYDEKRDRYIVHTGLHFALPDEYEMELRPRSSLTKTEVYMPNSPGTLDCGYRGELLVVFKTRTSKAILGCINNMGKAFNYIAKSSTKEGAAIMQARRCYNDCADANIIPYAVGDRICQLVIRRRELIQWDEVETIEELGTTERGAGGFGHTGGMKTEEQPKEGPAIEGDESPKVSGTNRFAK